MAFDKMRAHIIGEIRRIAAENGGRPPGIKRFATLTGIGCAQWRGKIWARWSEAVKEAGLTPNLRQEPLEKPELLACMATAIRMLQHIPSEAELELLRRKGHRIPVNQTYVRHFGGKPGLLRHLKQWTAATPGWSDVAALLADVPDEPEPEEPAGATGAVYLLKHGQHHKIGCSKQPEHRITELRVMLPPQSHLVHIIKTDDPFGVETYWHRRYAEKRVNGEWFKLTPQDVAAFRRWRCQ
ncbi:MAG TPA: GIY-YIG nuclease family protein [Micropepsaceae bacterium]|nr:GIY-YIG nuclease family protein [Micropepsaceae bacterium]